MEWHFEGKSGLKRRDSCSERNMDPVTENLKASVDHDILRSAWSERLRSGAHAWLKHRSCAPISWVWRPGPGAHALTPWPCPRPARSHQVVARAAAHQSESCALPSVSHRGRQCDHFLTSFSIESRLTHCVSIGVLIGIVRWVLTWNKILLSVDLPTFSPKLPAAVPQAHVSAHLVKPRPHVCTRGADAVWGLVISAHTAHFSRQTPPFFAPLWAFSCSWGMFFCPRGRSDWL